MKNRLVCFFILLIPLCLRSQEYQPTWQSINQRVYPQWFSDAKLGIFVHWGLYSVPAYAAKEGYAEWFYRGLMTGDAERRRVMSLYADTTLPIFQQYSKLAEHWHAELWDPAEWAQLFRESGAKYVLLVTKHHDGYCLWDSPQQPEWNSTVSGPCRNIVSELTDAVRKEGLRMGFYYSLPEWTNKRHIWMQDPDDSTADYVENYMIPQFKELVGRYCPDVLFTDGDWLNSAEQFHAPELISWYYNLVGPDAIVNDRWGRVSSNSGEGHGFRTPEYSAGIVAADRPWAECRGIGRSFGFNRNEDLSNFLTNRELIQHFCELVSRGGGLTINVGPMADGVIPYVQQERLKTLGKWLETNGEAIYGSKPYYRSDNSGKVIGTHNVSLLTQESLPVGNALDYDWVRNAPLKGMPVDRYSISWVGTVSPPKDGDYLLRLYADDEATVAYCSFGCDTVVAMVEGLEANNAVRPQVDTMLYYNHGWADNAAAQRMVHLQKERCYNFYVDYQEQDLDASIRLEWSQDGGKSYEPVPAFWHGCATWQRTIRCFTRRENNLYIIEFDNPLYSSMSTGVKSKRQSPKLVISDMPHLPKGTEITLLGTTQSLKWKQNRRGELTIYLSGIDGDEYKTLDYAWVFKVAISN